MQMPYRTGITDLSDSELLILDLLALVGNANAYTFFKKNYSLCMNIPYSHNLSDKKILLLLNIMQNKSIIDIVSSPFEKNNCPHYLKKYNWYTITSQGGELWERERNPVWSKFCRTSTDFQTVFFECIEEKLGIYCAEITFKSNLYNFSIKEIQCKQLFPGEIMYWKKFEHEFCWYTSIINCQTDECSYKDMKFYEKHRCWWSDLMDLQSFL